MLKEPMIFTTLFIICLAVDKLAGGGLGSLLAGLAILEIITMTFKRLEAADGKILHRREENRVEDRCNA